MEDVVERENQAKRIYHQLRTIEEKTRQDARNIYAHPDNENFARQLEDGMDEYPVIITQFGRWAVTEAGIECLGNDRVSYYYILAETLNDDWIGHMCEKPWVTDLEDFTRALYHARAIHRYLGNLKR